MRSPFCFLVASAKASGVNKTDSNGHLLLLINRPSLVGSNRTIEYQNQLLRQPDLVALDSVLPRQIGLALLSTRHSRVMPKYCLGVEGI